jgi:hypothetical protein
MASGPIYLKWNGIENTLPTKVKKVARVILSICCLAYLIAFLIALGSTLTPQSKSVANLVKSTEPPVAAEDDSNVSPADGKSSRSPIVTTVDYELNMFIKRDDMDTVSDFMISLADSGQFGPMPSNDDILKAFGDPNLPVGQSPEIYRRKNHVLVLAWFAAINKYSAQGKLIKLRPHTPFVIEQSYTTTSDGAKNSDTCVKIKVISGPFGGREGYCVGYKGELVDTDKTMLSLDETPSSNETATTASQEVVPIMDSTAMSRESWKSELAKISPIYSSSGKLLIPTKNFLSKFGNPAKTASVVSDKFI